ncbi:hypothetical protein VNO77_36077 [Canavalia gladiata]|uniref:B box-type domain-containing protein n=1 Tax=Canavalia gladiata TaxID=3824 RepID=A0AAN9K8U2_CANGL
MNSSDRSARRKLRQKNEHIQLSWHEEATYRNIDGDSFESSWGDTVAEASLAMPACLAKCFVSDSEKENTLFPSKPFSPTQLRRQKEEEMKIQCDACQKDVASLFCPADEAALCHACDHTIHHANKLAGQHKRFSLHQPTSKHSPLCDICHERRAYLFCKEDRAILCRECDLSTHGVNEHTKKHNRFLLTGVKIGASFSSSSSSDPKSFSSVGTEVRTSRSKINRPSSFSNQNLTSSRIVEDNNMACDMGSVSTSSISEYLIQTIPGYCMEDLLDASFTSNDFSQDYEHQSTFQNQDVFPLQAQFEATTWNIPQIDSLAMERSKAKAAEGYGNWRYNNDDYNAYYNVPSINPPLIKRCRRPR